MADVNDIHKRWTAESSEINLGPFRDTSFGIDYNLTKMCWSFSSKEVICETLAR